ncbi:MAG: hypothetical protein AAF892_07875 [Cyanobacteria bacterium P01_D01_bin.71]
MAIEMICPTCGSHEISKNVTTRRGKQNDKYRDYNRQSVEDLQWQPRAKDTFGVLAMTSLHQPSLAASQYPSQSSSSNADNFVDV